MAKHCGIFEVCSGDSPTIDIVAVHGLNGDAYRTWTTEKTKKFWLGDKDMLPNTLRNARIMTFGYNANVTSLLGSTSSDGILQHAQTLVAQLESERSLTEGAAERPIIFICHSLGGIIVKRALAYSASRTSKGVEHLHSIFVSTFAVLFLGTPHAGSSKARMASIGRRMLDALAPSKIWDTNGQLLEALQEGSETLQNVTDQFVPLMKKFRIYFFWEQEKTDLQTTRDYIVEESSAAPILDGTERSGIPAGHRQMCRFEDRQSAGYKVIAAALLRYDREAPDVIARRWIQAKTMLAILRREEAQELTSAF